MQGDPEDQVRVMVTSLCVALGGLLEEAETDLDEVVEFLRGLVRELRDEEGIAGEWAVRMEEIVGRELASAMRKAVEEGEAEVKFKDTAVRVKRDDGVLEALVDEGIYCTGSSTASKVLPCAVLMMWAAEEAGLDVEGVEVYPSPGDEPCRILLKLKSR
ncbi:MAG: hypothetical protein GXO28_06305 [Methanopyri archaeon]|nr:hypothetical protein [Methanopyri archaeon]